VADRRQHVRARPVIDLPAEADLVPPVDVGALFVVDISLGGIGIWAQGRPPFEAGQRVTLKLTLGRADPLILGALVRYTRGPDKSFCGMKFDELDDEQRAAVGRYVGELVERGSLV
jgi:c-di-GMP-binding flagellar brake protein YcgR